MNWDSLFSVDLNTVTLFFCALFLFAAHGSKLPTAIISYTFLIAGFGLILLNNVSIYKEEGLIDLFSPYDIIEGLLLIPALCLYLYHLMQPGSITLKSVSVIYGPTFALILLYVLIVNSQGRLPAIETYADLKVFWLSAEMLIRILLTVVLFFETIVLVCISFRMYRVHKENINYNFSYVTGSSLKWVPWINYLILLYGICLVLSKIKPYPFELISSFILVLLPISLSLMAIRQKRLFEIPQLQSNGIAGQADAVAQEEIKSFKDERMKQLKAQLLDALESKEMYKDSELSLDKVCSMLATNRNYLYQIIKNDLNTNFYDLINSYRLKHAAALLEKPDYAHMKIVHISEMVGFKNVSSFITLFKKKYNATPNDWRATHLF